MKLTSLLLIGLCFSSLARQPIELNELPEEIRKQIESGQAAIGKKPTKKGGPSIPGRRGKTPEQQRSELLKKMQIDRTPSGILQARLEENRLAEEAAKKKPEKPKEEEKPEEEKKKEISPQEQKKLDQKKLAQYRKDIETLRRNVVLGHWDKVRTYLETLPDNDAATAFSTIVTRLGSQVDVNPRGELSAIGAPGHKQAQYLRPHEILSLSDTAKKTPEKNALESLAKLIKRPPKPFFESLKKGTRYFGMKDEDTKHRTAKLLIDAGFLKDSVPFLPLLEKAREDQKWASINLIARFHANAHQANLDKDYGKTHLPKAWELCLELIGEKEAPLDQRGEALYRALSLVPELKGDTGSDWLKKTFSDSGGEGFEILAAVGTLTAQTRNHRSESFRLEQLRLQSAATSALLNQPDLDLTPWKETLTLYAINWNEEAERTRKLDTTTSARPEMEWDDFGNYYYVRRRSDYQGKGPRPITSGELLEVRPNDKWLAHIDGQVRLTTLERTVRLFLKVKEEEKAFPLIAAYSETRPKEAKNLVRELIRVWAENHNPNQANRYRSRYSFYWGYNPRSESIPLTRSKQERNLKKLHQLIKRIRALNLDDPFNDELADAFVQCHSQAEVWRVETLASVFGPATEVEPDTLSSLLNRMRVNLTELWPNPKLQQQNKTKRKDKELHTQIIKGYRAAQGLCAGALTLKPDSWQLVMQKASLHYEESNYLSALKPKSDHSGIKRQALDELQRATQLYANNLPREDQSEESVEPFLTWFYAALGSPGLQALKGKHQPVPSEIPKIKAALEALPATNEIRQRHLDRFAKSINDKVANVATDLKYRYLENALKIVGDHKEVRDASEIFQYYRDLITEIELETRIDGSDQIDANEPFGLYINLRHTKEIERESGGFQRYLQNQNSGGGYFYNFGRPTEDYRDKFEESARGALEEHFEIISLTFHSTKVQSRTDPEHGWTFTPYAYALLKAKGPEVDSIPPLKIDLDFLDTSGSVIIPITSAAIPIDASKSDIARPVRNLKVTMTVDEREAEKKEELYLEIRSTAHGLIPELDKLVTLPIEGFEITKTEDRDLQIEELDAQTDDGAPLASHEWRLTLEPTSGSLPTTFTFPEIRIETADEEGLTLQKYEDVDLVPVQSTMSLTSGDDRRFPWWLLAIFILGLGLGGYWFVRSSQQGDDGTAAKPDLPSRLTPVTLLNFLKSLQLGENDRLDLEKAITDLETRAFAPQSSPPDAAELQKIATNWLERA